MTGKLRTFVHVRDANGVAHAFGPGDDVPGWARDAITNPRAWETETTDTKPAAPRKPAKASRSRAKSSE